MNYNERAELLRLRQLEQQEKAAEDLAREEKKYEGYLFWCSDGCGFVPRGHRCEQWSTVTAISPALQQAMKEKFNA